MPQNLLKSAKYINKHLNKIILKSTSVWCILKLTVIQSEIYILNI